MTQSDPIINSVVSGVLSESASESPNGANTPVQQNFIESSSSNTQQMISPLNLVNSTSSTDANLLLLQQQLKLNQQQYKLDENILNKTNKIDFQTALQNPSLDPILLAAAAASNSNNLLLNKLPSFDNLTNQTQQQQQQVSSTTTQPQNMDPKRGAVGLDHPDADKWFYLDPQNQIQGSFTSEQMAGWFAAGYFPLNLMIKRGCDEKFLPLGN